MIQEKSQPIQVLLVDDEVSFGRVLVKRMAKRGIDAKAAASGREALVRLREQAFDVAVVDLKMEHMSGLEVLGIFRKMAPEMKVIILTGHGAKEEATAAMRLGAFNYLLKPCGVEEIIEAIQRAVEASQREAAEAAGNPGRGVSP